MERKGSNPLQKEGGAASSSEHSICSGAGELLRGEALDAATEAETDASNVNHHEHTIISRLNSDNEETLNLCSYVSVNSDGSEHGDVEEDRPITQPGYESISFPTCDASKLFAVANCSHSQEAENAITNEESANILKACSNLLMDNALKESFTERQVSTELDSQELLVNGTSILTDDELSCIQTAYQLENGNVVSESPASGCTDYCNPEKSLESIQPLPSSSFSPPLDSHCGDSIMIIKDENDTDTGHRAESEDRESDGSTLELESDQESVSDSESDEQSESEEDEREIVERPMEERREDLFQRELADAIVRKAPVYELKGLIERGATVSAPVTQGLTPLHYAVWQRYPEAVHFLIEEGCDLNAKDDIGYTPLHLCSEHGYLDMMHILLTCKAQVNFNHFDEEDLYPIDAVDEPLRLALKHDQIEAARLLLENKADPNGRYFFGSEINLVSPLKPKLLELLLSWGAKPNTRDRYGFTPIMKACHVQQEAEEELEEKEVITSEDILRHFAQTLKGIQSVLVLISHGADINLRTDARHECRSVLHYAILSGSSPIVSLLLKQGAKVNLEPEYNKASPLHLAVLKGDTGIINMLLDAEAAINITTPTVGSPLHVACSEQIPNRMAVLQLLLERGADPNIVVRSESGRPLKPPLGEYLANSTDHDIDVVKLFLRYGAQVVMQAPQQCPLGLLNCLYTVAKNREIMIELLEAAERFDVPLIRKTPLLVPSVHRDFFIEIAATPSSLQHLARIFVRQVMRRRRPETIEELGLPSLLRRYLLYEIN